jgi:hypothetical protein
MFKFIINMIVTNFTFTLMGNPLSPFMCNLFMLKIENLLRKNPLFPRFWKRYVDDIFTIIKRQHLQEFFDCLNDICQQIKFTFEPEENGALAFLDLKIMRDPDGKILFDIYRKPTSTDHTTLSTIIHTKAQHLTQ